MNLSNRVKILLSLIIILFISIPITLAILPKTQNTRSNAAPLTTITLIPQPGQTSSIQKNKGDDVPIEIRIDPGTNIVSTLRLQISYDTSKLKLDDTKPFEPATQDVNGPQFQPPLQTPPANGKFAVIMQTGDSASNAIQSAITVGTLHFKAIQATGDNPTEVALTDQTQVYAIDAPAKENVLKSHPPAEITIKDTGSPIGPGTQLSAIVLLDGIGVAGDFKNPTANDLSNKDPKTPDRKLQAIIYNTNNQQVATAEGIISYVKPDTQDNDDNVGKFMGTITVDKQLANGQYKIKVKTDRYLRRAFPSPITIDSTIVNPLPSITLFGGDTDGNNTLNAADYSILLDCGFGALNPLPMANPSSLYMSQNCTNHGLGINVDLNDDGIIDAFDYNLFIRESPVGSGD